MQDTLLRRYDPETCHTSKRGSRLLLVRLNVGARTDDVWYNGEIRKSCDTL